MIDTLYPTGYGTELVTMAELRRRHEPNMHPEDAARLFPFLASCGGLVGIGGGYRADGTQPDRPGFAKEGQSFHQLQQFTGQPRRWYTAQDLVVRNETAGGRHRAPRWSEIPAPKSATAIAWGLHCNVYPSEPWHLQPIELGGWRTWTLRGRPDLRSGYPIPARPRQMAPRPTQRRRLIGQLGNSPAEVAALQNVCNWWGWRDDHGRQLLPDGKFGALTGQAVASMQRTLNVADDQVYGPATAAALQAFLDGMAAL